jgi:mono/diheme cytochrome c family protein
VGDGHVVRTWILRIAVVGVVLLVIALIAVYAISERQLRQTFPVTEEILSLPPETGDADRGEHVVRSISVCVDCHGEDLGGEEIMSIPLLARVVGPNLTAGEGGLSELDDREIVLAVRHGLDGEGRPLIVMPSQNFWWMSDDDMAAVIAHLRQVQPVDRDLRQAGPGLMIRGPMVLGIFNLLPAGQINHNVPSPEVPAAAVTPDYGRYLTSIGGCRDCHGTPLSGGRTPGGGPTSPDLTRTGAAARWSAEDFRTAMREGRTPGGSEIDPIMPWRFYAGMTDDELDAIHAYLQTLPEGTVTGE